MKRNRKAALALALLVAFGLVWPRLRIYLWLHMSFWSVILQLLGLALVLYLGISALTEHRPADPSTGDDER